MHEKENEYVVASALTEYNAKYKDGDERKWEITSPLSLKCWSRRGKETSGISKKQANALLRVDGNDGDSTNGFFVAYFVRKGFLQGSIEGKAEGDFVRKFSAAKGFYNGEFLQQPTHISKSDSCQSQELLSNKAAKGIAKKKAKKLEWKRKQKEAKLLRLKKKTS